MLCNFFVILCNAMANPPTTQATLSRMTNWGKGKQTKILPKPVPRAAVAYGLQLISQNRCILLISVQIRIIRNKGNLANPSFSMAKKLIFE